MIFPCIARKWLINVFPENNYYEGNNIIIILLQLFVICYTLQYHINYNISYFVGINFRGKTFRSRKVFADLIFAK